MDHTLYAEFARLRHALQRTAGESRQLNAASRATREASRAACERARALLNKYDARHAMKTLLEAPVKSR